MLDKKLRMLRNEKHLTQVELAKILNIGNKTISDYERGISSPDIDTINLLADFFNVSTDYLLGLSDIRNPKKAIEPKNIQFALHGLEKELTDEDKETIMNLAKALVTKNKGTDRE